MSATRNDIVRRHPYMSSYIDIYLKSAYAAIPMDVSSLRDLAAITRGRRRDLGLTQADLAARARVSRQWVSAFERGKATAEIGLVIRLLDALDLRLAVTGSGAPGPARVPAPVDLDALLEEQQGP
jgi:HTH-type transcriptional regulator/antitoxin HipB